ncbi:hypothetical protein EV359DRAFT_77966 [Lentinula novae-zelandiae]|nr:hypothetical protein EV359DRAFT_77966 [Lentinula novae-zelandiae]
MHTLKGFSLIFLLIFTTLQITHAAPTLARNLKEARYVEIRSGSQGRDLEMSKMPDWILGYYGDDAYLNEDDKRVFEKRLKNLKLGAKLHCLGGDALYIYASKEDYKVEGINHDKDTLIVKVLKYNDKHSWGEVKALKDVGLYIDSGLITVQEKDCYAIVMKMVKGVLLEETEEYKNAKLAQKKVLLEEVKSLVKEEVVRFAVQKQILHADFHVENFLVGGRKTDKGMTLDIPITRAELVDWGYPGIYKVKKDLTKAEVCIRLPPSELEDQLCEYFDPKLRRTEAQVLKETIKTLEARIRELQISSDASVVKLHSPYQVQKSNSEGFLNPPQDGNVPQLLEAFFRHATDLNFFLHTPRFRRAVLLPVDSPGRPCQGLISVVFLLGFSLSERYILKPEESHSHNNILNDGVFASASVSSQEALYLSRAQIDVAGILSSSHPDRIVHGIQAELLLSTYLFRSGCILEGKYHLSAATSIAFGAKLHKIRSLNGDRDILTSAALPWVVPGLSTSSTSKFENRLNVDSAKDPDTLFPHSVDPISEGERINAFWTVITMSNCWALAADSSPNPILERYMEDIDTPWPMDIEDYEKNLSPDYLDSATVLKLLRGHQPGNTAGKGYSKLALHAQASIFLSRAASIALAYHPNMQSLPATEFATSFLELDSVIDHFIETLKSPISNDSHESILFTTHMIAHLATILLHSKIATMSRTLNSSLNSFPLEASDSGQKRLDAAVVIAELSRKRWSLKRNTGFETSTKIADRNPNPFLGSLWLAVGQVLIEEVDLVRVLSNGTGFTLNVESDSDESSPSEREAELMDKLECVFESAQMSRVYHSPLADYLFNKLQKIHRSRLHGVDDALPN